MGLKSDLYDLAGKIETKYGEIHEISLKLEVIKGELLTIHTSIKTKADQIKEA